MTEKGRDLSPMTKDPIPTEKSNNQRDNIQNATKNLDYTTIADRLRTVSWRNSSHPTGVVKPVMRKIQPLRFADWLQNITLMLIWFPNEVFSAYS